MFKAKKTIMYIDVKGVDDMTDRRDLMREVIRRNCDVDSRIIDSLVDKLGSCGDKDHMRIAETSSQFTDNENAYEIEKAIDKIVAADPINIYKKLKITVPDEDTLGQTA